MIFGDDETRKQIINYINSQFDNKINIIIESRLQKVLMEEIEIRIEREVKKQLSDKLRELSRL